jgi:hypothetical protein
MTSEVLGVDQAPPNLDDVVNGALAECADDFGMLRELLFHVKWVPPGQAVDRSYPRVRGSGVL